MDWSLRAARDQIASRVTPQENAVLATVDPDGVTSFAPLTWLTSTTTERAICALS